ncbi:MAG: helix-turn-helix domain-containing protein [Bacillota bacterium]|nr:helix-turn-helix domain-containing protein [Bacillota bacterium]
MTTEMMLKQDFLTKQLRAEKNAKDNFIKDLILGQFGSDLDLFIERGRNFNIDLLLARQAVVIDVIKKPENASNLSDELQEQIHKDELLKILENYFNDKENLIIYMGKGRFVVLKRVNYDDPNNKAIINRSLREISNKIQKRNIQVLIGIGNLQIHWLNLKSSYQEACDAVILGAKVNKEGNIFHIQDLIVERSLNSMDDFMKRNIFNSFIGPAESNDGKQWSEMERTLITLFDSNLNVSEAAKRLYLHRNSLAYRLQKVTECTGLDPLLFYDAVKIYIGLTLNKLK